jgi:hypothetical protein
MRRLYVDEQLVDRDVDPPMRQDPHQVLMDNKLSASLKPLRERRSRHRRRDQSGPKAYLIFFLSKTCRAHVLLDDRFNHFAQSIDDLVFLFSGVVRFEIWKRLPMARSLAVKTADSDRFCSQPESPD